MILPYRYVRDFFVALALFVIVCGPSIKIFIYSPIVNAIGAGVLLLLSALLVSREASSIKVVQVVAWAVFSVLLFAGYLGTNYFSFPGFLKHIYLVVVVLLAIIAANYQVSQYFFNLILLWAILLGGIQLAIGVELDKGMGQHYLTIATPLGMGICQCLAVFFDRSSSTTRRAFLLSVMFFLIIAVASTHSRSALVFPVIVLLYLLANYVVFSDYVPLGRKFVLLSAMGAVVLGVFYIFMAGYIDLVQLSRLERLLTNIDSEPRIATYYLPALEAISNRLLLGHGTDASVFLYGNYAHNIFLDVLTYGGVALLLPCLVIWGMFFYYVARSFSRISDLHVRGVAAVALFLFLLWNVSWGVDSAYMFIIPMVVAINAMAHKAYMLPRQVGHSVREIPLRRRVLAGVNPPISS